MNRRKPAAFAATRALKPALMAGGMIAVATALPLLGAGSAQNTLTSMLAEGGMRGPAMFLLLATFLTAIGLPRQIPAFVAGYAFGPWYGTAIALVSQVLACSLDFIWARALGQDFVRRRFGKVLTKSTRRSAPGPSSPRSRCGCCRWAAIFCEPRRRPFLGARLPVPAGLDHRLRAADRDFALFGQGSAPSHAHVLLLGAAMFAISACLGLILLRRRPNLASKEDYFL